MSQNASKPLEGKVVAITGASSGIGEATALACAQAGASVALAARRAERLTALVKKIEDDGGQAIAIPTDITDEAQARNFITQTHSSLGQVDVLINNAGVMLLGPIVGPPVEDWQRMVDLNILGVLYCTHAALPLMVESGGGHIINVSSVAGKAVAPGGGVYSMTKFAVGAFSEALRQELMNDGVRVTLIEPGRVDTELIDHVDPELRKVIDARWVGVTPLNAHDIATAIMYALTQPDHVIVNQIALRSTISPV
ncbi:SDR family oxidoreductase [Mycobacterium sp.]|uniref:SDR family oxidoreductase n=1 Tax=Mycobacterium sp. TaxID=1785 RepID=UPI002D8C21FE|nr:SDR family NAD(P)-dependent oxidoreductase [Mycobacterium sp.]